MADDFKHDPEGEEQKQAKFYRLPFALCKKYGIPIQDWWRPRDAWNALKNGGLVEDPSEEMKRLIRKKKQEPSREASQTRKERQSREGVIAGVPRGEPMSFEQADGGKVNPFFESGGFGYKSNCQACVAAYVARRKGYNVRALPYHGEKAFFDLAMKPLSIYKDKAGKQPKAGMKLAEEGYQKFLERTVKSGRIYTMQFRWKDDGYGHIITAERTKNGIRLYDPQNGEIVQEKGLRGYLRHQACRCNGL